jgi:hypothetical protein
MCTTKDVHVRVHVFSSDREKLFTIFTRGFHRKLQDEARRSVPDASLVFFFDSAFAHRIRGRKELAPTAFGRPHHLAPSLDELRRARFYEAWTTPRDDHEDDRRKPVCDVASCRQKPFSVQRSAARS